jgi:hypothetical protein
VLSSIGWGVLCLFSGMLVFFISWGEIKILKDQIKEKKVREN